MFSVCQISCRPTGHKSYIFNLDWTSAIRAADLCSISFSSCVNGCLTMCVTPFSPRTQGSDRNTSLSMPCWSCKVKKNKSFIWDDRYLTTYWNLTQLRLEPILLWFQSYFKSSPFISISPRLKTKCKCGQSVVVHSVHVG